MMQTCSHCNLSKPVTSFLIRHWKTSKGERKSGPRKVCKDCDSALRRESYAAPDSKRRATRRRHYAENIDAAAEYRKRYYAENKEKWTDRETGWRHSERAKDYDSNYRARPETRAASALRGHAWRQANKPRLVMKTRKRQAHVARATPRWANEAAIQLLYETAAYLTLTTGEKHEVDHFYPLQGETVCGLHVETNLRVITATENRKKRNRMPE